MYMDAAELTLKNEMAVNQFPNGGFGHHIARIEDEKMDGYFGVGKKETQEAYWCCSEHGPRALLSLPSYTVASRGHDLYVNLYDQTRAVMNVERVAVEIEIQPSSDGQTAVVALRPERPVKLRLLLRSPGWCRGFHVDGQRSVKAGNRHIIERVWKSGDKFAVRLPREVHVRLDQSLQTSSFRVNPNDVPRSGLLFDGPYLLGFAENAEPPRISLRNLEAARALMSPVSHFAPKDGFRCRVSLTP